MRADDGTSMMDGNFVLLFHQKPGAHIARQLWFSYISLENPEPSVIRNNQTPGQQQVSEPH